MKKLIKLSQIETNEGQIENLKPNPRFIKDDKFQKLVQSIRELPEMLEYRPILVCPHKGKYIAIGGNMRLRALDELKYKEVWCEIIADDITIDQMNEIIIKDNLGYGAWDWDMIVNNWDKEVLEGWGMDVDFTDEEPDEDEDEPKEIISTKLTVECDNVEKLAALFEELQGRNFKCKLL